MGHKFKTPTELYISYLRPLHSPCQAALGSETRFPLWGGGKSANSRFFLSRSALSLFSALFFFALLRSFFGFAYFCLFETLQIYSFL
jgi:hypothetical protein